MKRALALGIVVAIFASAPSAFVATPSQAGVVDISECRIPASKNQTVSLGFPLRPERISTSKTTQILVVPITPSNAPDYQFSQDFMDNYINAASAIEELSFGRAKINYIFAPVYRVKETVNDFVALSKNQQSSWENKDLAKSTWGFVRNAIKQLDPGTNFTNIDAVILEVGSLPQTAILAEAFPFHSNSQARQDGWFDPIKTDEGHINNVVLFGQHGYKNAIVHEIMHNYGLQDLYGGAGPKMLSLMDITDLMSLLNYEKWILGWLDDSNVTCLDAKNVLQGLSIDSSVKIKNTENHLAVINTGNGTGLVIEVFSISNVRRLIFYSLDNEERPPITFFQDTLTFAIQNPAAIGSLFKSPKLSLLVSNVTQDEISLTLIPESLKSTDEAKNLISQALANKDAKISIARIAAAAKAAAEKAAAKKPTTITCIKGKSTKKITAVNPKCPAGYKKK